MTPEALEKAVLVYGPRKSGSTLLQSLLDGGPELLMLPGELKLKVLHHRVLEPRPQQVRSFLRHGRTYFTGLGLDSTTPNSRLQLGHLERDQLGERMDEASYLDALADLALRADLELGGLYRADAAAFARAQRTACAYTHWASKEVGGLPSAIIAHFKAAFPAGKVILGTRDPKFIVASIVRDRTRRGMKLGPADVIAQCFEAENILHFLATVPLGQDAIVVSYENLVANVEHEMRRLARFLGIEFGDYLTIPTTLGVPTRVWTASENKVGVFHDPGRAWHSGLPHWASATIGAYFSVSRFRGLHRSTDVPRELELRATHTTSTQEA